MGIIVLSWYQNDNFLDLDTKYFGHETKTEKNDSFYLSHSSLYSLLRSKNQLKEWEWKMIT